MSDNAIFWDQIADKYAKSPIANMDAYNYTLERTRSYLSPNDHVLELGCGTGSTALLLAGNVKEITATDISAKMIGHGIEKAKQEGITNINFVRSEVHTAGDENHQYDVVLAFNLLHLLEDLPAATRRINSLLKPGGIFISKTVGKSLAGAPLKFRLMKLVLPLMQLIGKAPYVNFMAPNELEEIITNAGFKIIETGNYPSTSPSRYIAAKKE